MAVHKRLDGQLERLAEVVTAFVGGTTAFLLACLVVLLWIATGPLFHYSATWQLIINTGTTIITFLMVFLIQRSQKKSSLALQLKVNEIVAALEGASNRLVNVEDLTEDELTTLHLHYRGLAERARRARNVRRSLSVEETTTRRAVKRHGR